jgi:hypothetical protein
MEFWYNLISLHPDNWRMKFGWVLIVVFVLIGNYCIAQEIKKFTAIRTDYSPKIDGILNDRVWKPLVDLLRLNQFRVALKAMTVEPRSK